MVIVVVTVTNFVLSVVQLDYAVSWNCVVDEPIVLEPRLGQPPELPFPGTPLLYHCNRNCRHRLKSVRLLLVPRSLVPVPVVLAIALACYYVVCAHVLCILLEYELECVAFPDIWQLPAQDPFQVTLLFVCTFTKQVLAELFR